MGAVYSVNLKKAYRNKQAEKAVFEKLNDFVNTYEANFHKDTFEKEGVDLSTADGLIQVCLAGFQSNSYNVEELDGFAVHTNDFAASYGWERVMLDMFALIAPYFKDNSTFTIDIDNEYDSLIVKDGKAKQLH